MMLLEGKFCLKDAEIMVWREDDEKQQLGTDREWPCRRDEEPTLM